MDNKLDGLGCVVVLIIIIGILCKWSYDFSLVGLFQWLEANK